MLNGAIEERIDIIQEKQDLLHSIYSETNYSDRDREAVENCLRKIVSASIDIASRIIAVNGFRRPDNYAEYFEVLEEEQIIDEELSQKLQKMAKFRNVIIHQYHQVSFDQLEEIIENDLNDIEKFLKAVENWSSQKEKEYISMIPFLESR
jgi:uncharacterized protein YutE (UPF0331/DUF86 family)